MSRNRKTLGGSAVGRVGLRGAPAAAEQVGFPAAAQVSDEASPRGPEATASRAPEPAPPRAQPVERPVQYTLRMSWDESERLDAASRAQRRELSRHVDRSEVLRALIGLVDEDPAVRAALTARLTGRA